MDERPVARPLPGRQRENDTSAEGASKDGQRSRQQHGGGSDKGPAERQGGRPVHRKPCRRYETRRTACLNGGRCFVMQLHSGLRRPGCRYVSNYVSKVR